jgi:ABC-type transporter Mla MlaB component
MKDKTMLKQNELAKLTNALQVPLLVQDILDGEGELTADVEYGLHEVISNYQPDSVLLCIALSGLKMAQRLQSQYKNMGVLHMECVRIINDYAPLWIDHAQARPIDETLVFDTLSDIPEDLDCLAELFELNKSFAEFQNTDVAALCKIMAAQARAQALVADTFIDLIEQAEEAADNMPVLNTAYNDNVIPFPDRRAS